MADKKRRTARSFFTNNTALKIISLVFAIILWSFVTNSTNPERTKSIKNVKIAVQGIEALEEKGFIIREDLQKERTVDIKVKVKNSDYRRVNKDSVRASIDVSEIARDGKNSVDISLSFENLVDVSIDSIETRSIELTVDRIIKKDVPVVIESSGTLKEGLVSVTPQYPQTVSIEGSSFYLDRIENAVVNIDLSTLNDGAKISSLCKFVDKENNVVNFDGKRVDVDMDVQTKKEVSINAANAITNKDKLADGYLFAGISTGKITLCGHTEAINAVTEVLVEPIDLTGKDSSFTTTPLSLVLPEGVSILSGQDVPQAKIDIKEQPLTITVTRFITISGLEENFNATTKDGETTINITSNGVSQMKATVTLTGPKNVLESLKESDVDVRLSLLDKGKGTHELTPVVFLTSSLTTNVSSQIDSPKQITVTINTTN